MRYVFFIGSTDWYDAHTGTAHADAFPSLEFYRNHVQGANLRGVWEGVEENVLHLAVDDLASDEVAQRIAYAIGRRTANDAVLVMRDATPADDTRSLASLARYRVQAIATDEGNRTIVPGASSYRLERSVTGPYVAFLVWADASVTPVGE